MVALAIGFPEIAGCGRIVPDVYWRPVLPMASQDIAITTKYPDGSIESLRGKGSLKGKIRLSEVHSDTGILTIVVKKPGGNEYTIRIPGWQHTITPFEPDWWVVVDYSFGGHSESLNIMAQGHGQVFMYYTGEPGSNKSTTIIHCKLHNKLFLTSQYKTMACNKVLAHYSALCSNNKDTWPLTPGETTPLNPGDTEVLKAGTRILHLVDAFRIKKDCRHRTGSRITYYWFRIPHKTHKNKVVTKNDE